MSGRPTDGMPWWGKTLYYCIAVPAVAICEGVTGLYDKLTPKTTTNYYQALMDKRTADLQAEMDAINKRIAAARADAVRGDK